MNGITVCEIVDYDAEHAKRLCGHRLTLGQLSALSQIQGALTGELRSAMSILAGLL